MRSFFATLFGRHAALDPAPFGPSPKRMVHRLLHLKLPPAAPYLGGNDLASFVGIYVRPLVPHLAMFWFARYGPAGAREVKFKFSTRDYGRIRRRVEEMEKFDHGADGCVAYHYVDDLGGNRFLAPSRAAHKADRALGVYQFLTAGARLYVDCLVPEGPGWKLEEEKASMFNRETPMETFHHLLCNMTTVPTWAAVLQFPQQNNRIEVVSDLDARGILKKDPSVILLNLPKINH